MASSNGSALTKATLATANTASKPWASDTYGAVQTQTGVLVMSDLANATGSIIEVCGNSGTPVGNGAQLGPGDWVLVNVSTAAQVQASPSANSLLLRGLVL